MSEEYYIDVKGIAGRVKQGSDTRYLGALETLEVSALLAIAERLERLVEVLEQIRDRLPSQIAK